MRDVTVTTVGVLTMMRDGSAPVAPKLPMLDPGCAYSQTAPAQKNAAASATATWRDANASRVAAAC